MAKRHCYRSLPIISALDSQQGLVGELSLLSPSVHRQVGVVSRDWPASMVVTSMVVMLQESMIIMSAAEGERAGSPDRGPHSVN